MTGAPADPGPAVYLAFGPRLPAYGYMHGGALDVSRPVTLDELPTLNADAGPPAWTSVARVTPDGLELVGYWLPGASDGEVLHELHHWAGYETTDPVYRADIDRAFTRRDPDPWHRRVCAHLTR